MPKGGVINAKEAEKAVFFPRMSEADRGAFL